MSGRPLSIGCSVVSRTDRRPAVGVESSSQRDARLSGLLFCQFFFFFLLRNDCERLLGGPADDFCRWTLRAVASLAGLLLPPCARCRGMTRIWSQLLSGRGELGIRDGRGGVLPGSDVGMHDVACTWERLQKLRENRTAMCRDCGLLSRHQGILYQFQEERFRAAFPLVVTMGRGTLILSLDRFMRLHPCSREKEWLQGSRYGGMLFLVGTGLG